MFWGWIEQPVIALGETDLFITFIQPSLHGSLLQETFLFNLKCFSNH